MLTFDPERSIARAQRVLPAGGWSQLDEAQRRLILRAAVGMVEADAPATPDEEAALEHLGQFLELPPKSWLGVPSSDALVAELGRATRDRSFARHLFVSTYLVGMSDGVLMDSERAFLEACARAVE